MTKAFLFSGLFLLFSFIAYPQGIIKINGIAYDKSGNLINGKYLVISHGHKAKKVFHYKNGVLEGEYAAYDSNGNMIEKGNYHDGQKHGKWISWTSEGVKTGEAIYNYGVRDGRWRHYDAAGQLAYMIDYSIGDMKDVRVSSR